MKNKNIIKVLLIALVLVTAGVIYSCAAGKKTVTPEVLEAESTETESFTEETTEEEQICVHVCGHVNSPGVYYLKKGSRVHEAVELAGGLSVDADGQYVNLAEEAQDGAQIYIPSSEEVLQGTLPVQKNSAAAEDDGLVNLNTATVEELKTLPGIGDIKAEAIISYRESIGGFTRIEDIMNVAGIKESSYETIKDHIKV